MAFVSMLAYFTVIIKRNGTGSARMIVAGVILSFLLVLISHRVKFLDTGGAVSAFLMGSCVFGVGGVSWTVPLLTFFLSSSLLSKAGQARKMQFQGIFEKGSRRDAAQVLGNGGLAWLMIILYSFDPRPAFFVAYLAALASTQADSWATEIGTMVPDPRPRSVVGFRPVAPGTSGGVTWLGTLGGVMGALLICASAWAAAPGAMQSLGAEKSLLVIGLSGALGGLVDSILGATIQGRYYDPEQARVTERARRQTPDGPVKNDLVAGVAWLNNDIVNFCCSLSGAAIGLLLFRVLHSDA
jgi:uncharacterized protein (TIGR00297 family)